MLTIWLNGDFLDPSEAPAGAIAPLDAGLQHGVGLFETMTATTRENEPHIHHLDRHIARLLTSAAQLGLAHPTQQQIREATIAATRRCAEPRTRVRVTITGGDLNLLARARARAHAHAPDTPAAHPTLLVVAQRAPEYPPEMFQRGIATRIARANPFNPTDAHKTLNYWWRLRELGHASRVDAGEALVFSVTNHLVGACVSNAFVIKDQRLLTPIARGEEHQVGGKGAIPSATLPGITRATVLEWAVDAGLEVDRRMLTINDVLQADEIFLTNSGWGVLPVTRVEKRDIGPGRPGDVTKQAIKATTPQDQQEPRP